MQPVSWYIAFCNGTAPTSRTAADVQAFLSNAPVFTRDVNLPSSSSSAVLPAMRIYYPMTAYRDNTEKDMDALQATNTIVGAYTSQPYTYPPVSSGVFMLMRMYRADASALSVTAFGPFFTVFSMFQRIQDLL